MERKHYIYKIINKLDGKYYIGVHSIKRENDCYFGSGSALKAAIRKHGKENFEKIIINYYVSREEALIAEKEYVNNDILSDTNSYNLVRGGGGIVSFNRKKRSGFLDEFESFYVASPVVKQADIQPVWRSETERYIFELDYVGLKKRDDNLRDWHKKNSSKLTLMLFDFITSKKIYDKLAKDMSGFYNDMNKEKIFKEYIKKTFQDYGMIEYCSIKAVSISYYEKYLSENKSNA